MILGPDFCFRLRLATGNRRADFCDSSYFGAPLITLAFAQAPLVRRNAIGLVTTHDLALTEIATNGMPGANAYFEDSGELGELRFDYHLRPGVLSHSNALNIAHILGIDAAADEGTARGAESGTPKKKE